MWKVSWQYTRPSQRGGLCTKTETKYFRDYVEACRYAHRVAVLCDAEWCRVERG